MTPEIAQNLATLSALQPSLAGYFMKDIAGRYTAKVVLKNLRSAGFDLSSPSGVVLEALLRSGSVSPTEALAIYIRLNQAQQSVVAMQSALIDLEYKRALLERTRAETLLTLSRLKEARVDLNQKLIDGYFKPKMDMLQSAIQETQRLLNNLTKEGAGVYTKQIQKLEATLQAQRRALELLSLQRLKSLEELNALTEQGYPAPLIVSTAIARANNKVMAGFSRMLQDETLALPEKQDIVLGKVAGQEFVNILSTFVNPEYARLVDVQMRLASDGILPPTQNASATEGSGLADYVEMAGLGAIGLGAGYGVYRKFVKPKREKAETKTSARSSEGRLRTPMGDIETRPKSRMTIGHSGWIPKMAGEVGKKYVPHRIKQLENLLKALPWAEPTKALPSPAKAGLPELPAPSEPSLQDLAKEEGRTVVRGKGGLWEMKGVGSGRKTVPLARGRGAIMVRGVGLPAVGMTLIDMLLQMQEQQRASEEALEEAIRRGDIG